MELEESFHPNKNIKKKQMKLIIGFLTYIGILFAIVGGAALFSNLVAYFVKEENKSFVRLIDKQNTSNMAVPRGIELLL